MSSGEHVVANQNNRDHSLVSHSRMIEAAKVINAHMQAASDGPGHHLLLLAQKDCQAVAAPQGGGGGRGGNFRL